GSKVQPAPGIALPMLAYIGSSADGSFFSGALAPVGADLAEAVRFTVRAADASAFGSRLLCQTRLLPCPISSIVRPVLTDVMFSATTSSVLAYSSRCLMSSHCGFDELEPSR